VLGPHAVGFSGRRVLTGSPYTVITSAVDWTDATIALGVIAAALALFLVFKKGARGVLGMISR
jgi:hypothetical protein